jgi:hypothetical protein
LIDVYENAAGAFQFRQEKRVPEPTGVSDGQLA